MKKSVIIIIALAIAIFFSAVVLVVSLFGPEIKDKFAEEETIYSYSYSMPPTATTTAIPTDTESWIDINMIASDLVTATDSDTETSETSETTLTTEPGTLNIENLTSIVYVDQFGNIIDPNVVNSTTTTTEIETDVAFEETVATTDDDTAFSEYEINGAGIITRYLGDNTVVMIPPEVQGVIVRGIGRNCFESRQIKIVQIPATVNVIEAGAFKDCKQLESVVFADTKVNVEIGNSAFKGCSNLKSINLPITSSIGMSAFESCKSLQEIDIKAGTKDIGQYCFAFCESLKSITIRDEMTQFNGVTTFQDHHPDLIIYCEVNSDVEFTLKNYGLNTSPIAG